MTTDNTRTALRVKLTWVGILYFSQGFPAGIFAEILPVQFREQGVDLREIGVLSLLMLGWTLKFLWAPLLSFTRRYRRWMIAADLAMAVVLGVLATRAGFGPAVWLLVGGFVLLSATNDIAVDAHTIEMLDKHEQGVANGFRIGFYRAGLMTTGALLVLQGTLGWGGVYATASLILVLTAIACAFAPAEKDYARIATISLAAELRGIVANPLALAAVSVFVLGTLWIVDRTTHWSRTTPHFWTIAFAIAAAAVALDALVRRLRPRAAAAPPDAGGGAAGIDLREGPMFGALLGMLQRPGILPVFLFILLFKLADTSAGFMVKPFWVDAGFTPAQIGTVSVNLGIALSIAGGLIGGWITDRIGIFHGLWILGLTQAFSNLGYALAAHVVPVGIPDHVPGGTEQMVMYGASVVESFTQGLGTGAFLAFLMAIVDKRRSATEYALLSALAIFSRAVAGWAGGHLAANVGYPQFFTLTFLLAFPAYLLLPWVRRMLAYAESQRDWDQR
jgi:MFS transporter, PAT family, beta-lactamase induction signal transducer AmpG